MQPYIPLIKFRVQLIRVWVTWRVQGNYYPSVFGLFLLAGFLGFGLGFGVEVQVSMHLDANDEPLILGLSVPVSRIIIPFPGTLK